MRPRDFDSFPKLIFSFVAILLLLTDAAHSDEKVISLVDPSTDYAFLEFEPYPSFTGESSSPPPGIKPVSKYAAAEQFWRLAGQMAFPAGKFFDHDLFGTFKSTLINRNLTFHDTVLNNGMLKRFWISGGGVILNSPHQSSMVLMGVGCNSDLADISWMDFNTEWLYIHSFKFIHNFEWGLGLDVQQYFHKFKPYPLIFIDWKLGPQTKIKWDADYLEVRQFLTPRICITAGTRFNLEFFALEHNATYEYHSMGLETGIQYALGQNFYLRLKYKELVWGEETYGLVDGSEHDQSIEKGRSLRLNVAYGI